MNHFKLISTTKLCIITGITLMGSILHLYAGQKFECFTVKQPIVIDGVAQEWSTLMTTVEDADFELGIQNDSDFLYLCLSSNDPEFKSMFLATGLNIWLDSKGKKKRNFGIHYPIGLSRNASGFGNFSRSGEGTPRHEKIQERLDYLKKDLDILGPKKDEQRRIFLNDESGIQAEIKLTPEGFVMEMKIPLHNDSVWQHALGIVPGSKISIGIETPEIKRKKGMNSRGMGQSGMSRQGRGSGSHGGAGGMGGMGGHKGQHVGGQRGDSVKKVKVWLKVNFI